MTDHDTVPVRVQVGHLPARTVGDVARHLNPLTVAQLLTEVGQRMHVLADTATPRDDTPRHPARVDWFRLGVDLDDACARRNLSLRAAGREIGLPVSALSKLRRGGKLSADSVARLAVWLYPHVTPPAWIVPARTDSNHDIETENP